MLKKTIVLILICLLSFSFVSCKNEEVPRTSALKESAFISSEVEKETTLTYDVYEDYVIITGSLSPFETLVIPETLSGKEVRAIDKDAFRDMTTLRAVTISDTVKEIRENAFSGCTALDNVVLPEYLYSIGTSAFFANTSLLSIRIPLGTKIIGAYSFADCSSLKNVFIPNGAESIGGGAFLNTLWLENKEEEFVTAGQNVLIHYSGSDEEVKIPDGITEISAFCENFFTKSIIIPESVERIGTYAFLNSSITSVTLGENIREIGDSAFDGCLNLEEIRFNDRIETIGDFAFTGCQAIKKITLPKSVKEVGDSTFARCDGLTELTFTSAKTKIGKDICESCSSLKKIACPKRSDVVEYAKESGLILDII